MKCFAYESDGNICNKPAVTIDRARGYYVCERHRRTYLFLTCALAGDLTIYFPSSWTRPQMAQWMMEHFDW